MASVNETGGGALSLALTTMALFASHTLSPQYGVKKEEEGEKKTEKKIINKWCQKQLLVVAALVH